MTESSGGAIGVHHRLHGFPYMGVAINLAIGAHEGVPRVVFGEHHIGIFKGKELSWTSMMIGSVRGSKGERLRLRSGT